ncbi:LAFE_0D04016g1_1 [Lachancea fermentati]|uniref:Chromatin modification-related protein EAF3 n=1 Tax=Lachancea fermentati TaxID=4955 RepID=A0A1G4MB94_LACFM|nr:LAFE_0D04016g1_1 [Lachancea fermentati]
MSLEVNSKCLAFHGPLLYAAKILKVHNLPGESEDKEGIPANLIDKECYYIHYQGWKSSWDEWVERDRIREWNDDNLALKKKLVEDARESQAIKKKATTKPKKADSKKKKTAGAAPEEAAPTGPRIIVHVPHELKIVLVDDWELITKDKKLVSLPCRPTVGELLDKYYKEISSTETSPVVQSQLQEYCKGIRLYFDQCLPAMLLYRFERLQLADYAQEPLHTVYGAIHLLRLLTTLPELVASTSMDEQSCDVIVTQTDRLLLWLAQQKDLFHSNLYENTSSQYEGVALGM